MGRRRRRGVGGVFYTKSTLAEQRAVLRQWERAHCQHQLNRDVLAGEELCAVTAPDINTQVCGRRRESVTKMGSPEYKDPVESLCTRAETRHAYKYARMGTNTWLAINLMSHCCCCCF